MIGTLMMVLAIAGQSPANPKRLASGGPDELISRLGSPRYAEREAAAAGLEKLGRLALPALLARREHRDLEIRTRVAALITRIEGSLLLEPTPVTLDFDDRPLAEVIAAINRRSDLPLSVLSGTDGERRVTLRSSASVPFWKAIDRLCDAGNVGYSLASQGRGPGRERSFLMTSNLPAPAGLISDHGPFRVILSSLHYQRDFSFDAPANVMPPFGGPGLPGREAPPIRTVDGRTIIEQFYLSIQAAAEPRLALRQTGSLKLTIAVDDLGQSLIPHSANSSGVSAAYTFFGASHSNSIQLQVPLRHPDSPSRVIRFVRGSIPVLVATRRPSPMVIPLEAAAGKTFHDEGVEIVVHDIKPMNPGAGANSSQILDLSITARPSRFASLPGQAPEFDGAMPRADLGPLQLELSDALGRPATWYVSGTQPEGEQQRVSLVINPTSGGGPPATLRYFGTVRAATEIPFEFRDVPMP